MRAAAFIERFEPGGWLFLIAGLAICASGILIPAQRDLESLERQVARLRYEEENSTARLEAYRQFLRDVDTRDRDLLRRLAAAQLNLMPSHDVPLLLTSSNSAAVVDWIEDAATVHEVQVAPVQTGPTSVLEDLATGPFRLWIFAGGALCIFVGLLMSPELATGRGQAAEATPDEEDDREIDHHAESRPRVAAPVTEIQMAMDDSPDRGVVSSTDRFERLWGEERDPARQDFDEGPSEPFDSAAMIRPDKEDDVDEDEVEDEDDTEFDDDEEEWVVDDDDEVEDDVVEDLDADEEDEELDDSDEDDDELDDEETEEDEDDEEWDEDDEWEIDEDEEEVDDEDDEEELIDDEEVD